MLCFVAQMGENHLSSGGTTKYLRCAFLIMAMGLIGAVGIRQARVYCGYCPSVGRTLSDQERIRSAVHYQLGTFRILSPTDSPAYESVDAFRKTFPDCCTIVDGAPEVPSPSWYERMAGITYRIVAIRRQAIPADGDETEGPLRIEFVPMSACGYAHSPLH